MGQCPDASRTVSGCAWGKLQRRDTVMIKHVLFLLLVLCWGTHVSAERIRFAPLPMESRETILKQFMPMVSYLQTKGLELEFDYSENYGEILEKFRQGRIDVAYLGPLPYVALREQYDQAEPIVHFREASGEASYTCSIVSLGDRNMSLEALQNATVALTQPLSTCGFLSTNGMLRQHGSKLADNLYRYLGKHDKVALAVVRGEYDMGGLKTAIGKKYAHLGLRQLAETGSLPGFALVGNRSTLSPEAREKLCDALSSLDPAGKDKDMMAVWGANIRYGAVKARDEDYANVRSLLGDETIPDQGNF